MDVAKPFNSVAHLLTIIDAIPSAVVMVNESGHIVLVNSQAENIFGYDRTELLDESVELLLPFRFRQKHPSHRNAFFKNATAAQWVAVEIYMVYAKGGVEFPIEIGLSPIETEEGLFVLSAIFDITERKRLENRFRATVESAPTAMVMIDQAGAMVLVNKETSALFGYETEELLNQKVEILVPQRFSERHPELRTQYFTESRARRMGAGRDLYGVHKDGTEIPVEIGLNPVETDEGNYVLAAIVDLTERKRTIEQLRKSNEALELSNMELQQFAYSASHDLQTPLRAVCGFSQCLENDYKDSLTGDAKHYLKRIIDGTLRMQTLVNDLLDFSRIESRAKPFQPVNLNEVFQDALAMLSVEENSEEKITKANLPMVMGDKSQLMQLFMNLIGNGMKYHGDEPVHIHVDAYQNESSWVISVEDNGIGMEEQYFDKIFEIFRRLHNKTDYPGTGIGLALCRRIVHRHGGEIWVESEPGKGSKFYISLKVYNPRKEVVEKNDARSSDTLSR